MPKYLDMPEGNGSSATYRAYLNEIERGRAVAVVRILGEDGNYGCFINSGDPAVEITEESALLHTVMLTAATRRLAEAEGNHPVAGYTRELIRA